MTAPTYAISAADRRRSIAASYAPRIGSGIKLDTWKNAERLVESDWDKAPFRITTGHRTGGAYLPTKSGYIELACRVEVTGHTVQWVNGSAAVRIRFTFVHDDEPDTYVGGWLFI